MCIFTSTKCSSHLPKIYPMLSTPQFPSRHMGCISQSDYHEKQTCCRLYKGYVGCCFPAGQPANHRRCMANHCCNGNGSLQVSLISAAHESLAVHSAAMPGTHHTSPPTPLSAPAKAKSG